MYCLGLFVAVYSQYCCVQTNKYDQSLRVTDSYIVTKFHYNMSFRYWVMGTVESEEEEDDNEQNSL